jgi:hypothetical protein
MQGRFNPWKHLLQTELAAEGTFPAGLSYLYLKAALNAISNSDFRLGDAHRAQQEGELPWATSPVLQRSS